MITKRNLKRHELIGLHAKVTAAKNEDSVGLEGEIADETQKTLLIHRDDKNRAAATEYKRVFKEGSTFEVRLPSGKTVELSGDEILARPWERISK